MDIAAAGSRHAGNLQFLRSALWGEGDQTLFTEDVWNGVVHHGRRDAQNLAAAVLDSSNVYRRAPAEAGFAAKCVPPGGWAVQTGCASMRDEQWLAEGSRSLGLMDHGSLRWNPSRGAFSVQGRLPGGRPGCLDEIGRCGLPKWACYLLFPD